MSSKKKAEKFSNIEYSSNNCDDCHGGVQSFNILIKTNTFNDHIQPLRSSISACVDDSTPK